MFYRVTGEVTILKIIAEKISQHNSAYLHFRPTEAVIVTWFNAILLVNRVPMQVLK